MRLSILPTALLSSLVASSLVLPEVLAQEGEAAVSQQGAADADGMQTTETGLKYRTLREGTGDAPTVEGAVRVHYTGKLADGRVFDSSRLRGAPTEFRLGNVIPGWQQALVLMKEGGHAIFEIPFALAYGEGGRPPTIPPRSDLTFDIELIEVIPPFEFSKPDEGRAEKLENGLVIETLEPGEGEAVGTDGHCELRFAIFNESGQLLTDSVTSGRMLAGPVADFAPMTRLGAFAELAERMRPGQSVVAAVPPALAWGQQSPDAKLPPNSTTYWQVKMTRAFEIPAFRDLDADRTETTPSGLQYEVLEKNDDPAAKQPAIGDVAIVDYAGWLQDGTPFDSSFARGSYFMAQLQKGGLIDGWIEGIPLMKEGETWLFRIPGSLAYGERGSPPKIPADATLVFLVKLHEVKK